MSLQSIVRRLPAKVALVCLMAAGALHAQPSDSRTVSWKLTGSLGTVGELYRIDGRANRRPNELASMFLRPVLTLADRYTIRGEVLLSTEGSSALARQSINQYMINPSWTWGTTHFSARIGDFSDTYTPTTYSGVQVRGGELAVRRKPYHVTVLGGRSSPATTGGPDGGSYQQALVAGQAGYADEQRAVTLFVLYAADDEGSLAELPDTASVIDSTEVGTPVNPYAVTPQENFVTAAWGRLVLLDKQLSLSGELSRSDYTRDRRAADGGSGRTATAFNVHARWNRQRYQLKGGYKRIAPGFVSLGVASMHSDQQELSVGGVYRLGSAGTARIEVSRQNDNLVDQKEATTVRYRYLSVLNLRPTKRWTTSISMNRVTMANGLSNDTTRVDFDAWVVTTNQVISFDRQKRLQSTTLGYTLQRSGDDNPLRVSSEAESHNVNGRVVVRLSKGVTMTPMIGVTGARIADSSWRRTDTYGLAMQHRSLANKLTSILSLTVVVSDGGESFRSMLQSQYSLTPSDQLRLRVSVNNNRASNGAATSSEAFDEYRAHFGWTHSL